jgi:hypothetical protein
LGIHEEIGEKKCLGAAAPIIDKKSVSNIHKDVNNNCVNWIVVSCCYSTGLRRRAFYCDLVSINSYTTF